MKIAIHHNPGSFSDRWIDYCIENSISFKLVNCYENDIISQLYNCDVLLWHHHHANFKDVLFAKQLLYSLEQAGKKVFPDFNTAWHFDDKVGQKYLFEAINAPIIKSYVFYSKKEARNWAAETKYPKVFKLRGGAGSANVRLVSSRHEAMKIIRKAFSKGFSQFDRWQYFSEQIKKIKYNQQSFVVGLKKGLGRLFFSTSFSKTKGKEKGYVYFQDFHPGNFSDIRVVTIRDKAFAIKRMVRKGDFRASGSGIIIYDKDSIDVRCIRIAFEVNRKIKGQCMAFDFIFDNDNNPLIVEISYGFSHKPYDLCPGYWTEDLNWVEGAFNPYGWMIDNIINII